MLARAAARVARRDDRRRLRPPPRSERRGRGVRRPRHAPRPALAPGAAAVLPRVRAARRRDRRAARFTPWTPGGGIRPVGPFQGLRDAAYGTGQRARLTG